MALPRLDKANLQRFLRFGIVGGLGVAVNLGMHALLYHVAGLPDFAARVLAIEVAVLHNFTWHRRWVWADRQNEAPSLAIQLLRYHLGTLLSSYIITLAAGWALMQVLPDMPVRETAGHLGGIGCGMVVNFLLADGWVFARKKRNVTGD
ncbi:MAG: GtrA family protein [bacterium]|nr:GtrA family protein [bacterium]